MGADSKIEWCHHTFNPWWGCTRVSPGCEHCYAETFAKRVGHRVWGPKADRRLFDGNAHWQAPLAWHRDVVRTGQRARVFCASMADVFEDRHELDAPRQQLWRLIRETPRLDWLLLTKRPENIRELAPESILSRCWIGATAEDRERFDQRVEVLRAVPACVRFLSLEPLLEDLGDIDLRGIDWVIVGGESGPGARPCDVAWIRSVRQRCGQAGVACFIKQRGSLWYDSQRSEGIRGSCVVSMDAAWSWIRQHDRKGGDWAEWPEDIRIREFPAGAL